MPAKTEKKLVGVRLTEPAIKRLEHMMYETGLGKSEAVNQLILNYDESFIKKFS